MPESVFPATIALIGVVISIIASALISLRQFRVESQKLRSEYLHMYAGKLFEKRLDVYPQISELLVHIVVKINLGITVSEGELKNLAEGLIVWNAKNSFLLSAHSEQITHELYVYLNRMTPEQRATLVIDSDSIRELKHRLLELYLALKSDLGIYALVSPSSITEFRSPESIKEVAKLSESEK